MQDLTIKRTNGNVPRSLAGQDHISGLLFYSSVLPTSTIEGKGFSADDRIQAISDIVTAEKYGITSDNDSWDIKVLHYLLSSTFNMNPGISLYVGIFPKQDNNTFTEIVKMQNHAKGSMRQIGVWNGYVALSADVLNALKAVGTTLEQQNKPLSILYAPKVTDITQMPTLAAPNQSRISVVVAQDGSGVADALYISRANSGKVDLPNNFDSITNRPQKIKAFGQPKASVSALGDLLGAVSLAKVNESVAWVEKFPLGLAVPAFSDGTLYSELDAAIIGELDASRYIFAVTYDGIAGTYFNDNHTLDLATSDYAYINDVRTMDKAVRNVRTYLLPKLGRPLEVEPSTGQLARTTIEHLITTGNRALEDMEKAKELSGYKFDIDPDQDVLSTSRVKGVIKNVAMGVMRNLDIEIGYALSV